MTLRHQDAFISCRRIEWGVGGGLLFGWVDPGGGWQLGWLRDFALEAFWIDQEGDIEGASALLEDRLRATVVNGLGCHEADTLPFCHWSAFALSVRDQRRIPKTPKP